MSMITYHHDRGGQDTIFEIGGTICRTGAAGTRCFRDIADQFSLDDALVTAREALRVMPLVEARLRGYRKPALKAGEAPIVVEAFLVAGGLSVSEAHEVSQGRYRNRRNASVDLMSIGFSPPAG